MFKKITVALCGASLLAACGPMMGTTGPTNGNRPAFSETVVGMVTVTSLIALVEIKRQQAQDKLKSRTNPKDIGTWQSRLTAIDAVKGNLLEYSANGQMSLASRIQLVNATSDLVKTRLPDYTDVINTLSTLSQALLAAQAQAKAAAAQ